jgi:hypothetical protein
MGASSDMVASSGLETMELRHGSSMDARKLLRGFETLLSIATVEPL